MRRSAEEAVVRGFTWTVAGGRSPSAARRTPMRGSPISDDRGVGIMLSYVASVSGRWRARARDALLGTALLTSPIVLPFALALLMSVLRGTPLGAAILERLHL